MKCPTCSKQGQKVGNETVKHILKPKYSVKIGQKGLLSVHECRL
jgi:hypothetical protein